MKSLLLLPLFFLLLVLCAHDPASGQPYQLRRTYPGLPQTQPQTHSLQIRCLEADPIPALSRKLGAALGVAPFEDARLHRELIGRHLTHGRITGLFRSEPFPLEKSFQDFFAAALGKSGVKTVFISPWDGKPESLNRLETDSVLKARIDRFWIKAETAAGRTRVYTWIYLDIRLGMKNPNRVTTQGVYVGEETIFGAEFSPQALSSSVNRTLRNVVESFFISL